MNLKILIHLFALLVGLFTGLTPFLAFAQTQATVTINPSLPGIQNVATAGPCDWLSGFYTFALIISGILAFGAVVWGGILYATSAGNASKQSQGRSWIWSALIGMLLLAGAYIVLYTVNPALVTCSLPTLASVGGSGYGLSINPSKIPPAPTSGNCGSGPCQILPNCTPTAGNAITGKGATNCGGAQAMLDLLTCVNQNDPNFTVNEAYPPTVNHTDQGHNTGCAIDVHVSGNSDVCSSVYAAENAVAKCSTGGLQGSTYDEYAGCVDSKNPSTRTGNNLHIDVHGGGC